MTYTVQPPSGTSLDPAWTSKGIIFARNEADLAVADTRGTATRSIGGNGPVWGTDANGRYKQAGADGGGVDALEKWSALAFGPEYTLISVVKRVNNGGYQAMLDSDDGSSARKFLFRFDDSGIATFISFDTGNNANSVSSGNAISSSSVSVVIARIRTTGSTFASRIWVDGVASAEASTQGGGPVSQVAASNIFLTATNRLGGSHRFDSKSYSSIVMNTGISDADAATVSANPWVVWLDSGSGGGTGGTTANKSALARIYYERLTGKSNV